MSIFAKTNLSTMKNLYLEIKDGEGGKDAKLLTEDMGNMYLKAAKRLNVNAQILE